MDQKLVFIPHVLAITQVTVGLNGDSVGHNVFSPGRVQLGPSLRVRNDASAGAYAALQPAPRRAGLRLRGQNPLRGRGEEAASDQGVGRTWQLAVWNPQLRVRQGVTSPPASPSSEPGSQALGEGGVRSRSAPWASSRRSPRLQRQPASTPPQPILSATRCGKGPSAAPRRHAERGPVAGSPPCSGVTAATSSSAAANRPSTLLAAYEEGRVIEWIRVHRPDHVYFTLSALAGRCCRVPRRRRDDGRGAAGLAPLDGVVPRVPREEGRPRLPGLPQVIMSERNETGFVPGRLKLLAAAGCWRGARPGPTCEIVPASSARHAVPAAASVPDALPRVRRGLRRHRGDRPDGRWLRNG
jgi:hypothetical protein